MFRFAIAIVAVCLFGLQADAQIKLFRRAQPAAQCTVDQNGVQTCSTNEMAVTPVQACQACNPMPNYASSAYSAPVISSRSFGSGGSAVNGGSTGGFAVGQRDSDGAIISSIGSTVSPTIVKAGTQAIEPLAFGDRIKFRRTLLAAAKQAREAGDITPAQYFMLSAASRNPNTLDKMQAAVHEAAIEEGLATTQAVDWDALIGFIEKLIPIIIQLIGLFS